MEKLTFINAIKVPEWPKPTLPDLGESINDTKIVCRDGELFVERSFLCWSSEIFWAMFSSGVGTIQRIDNYWIINLPDDSRKIVDMAYQISKRLFVRIPVSFEGKTDDQTTIDLIQFAQQYQFLLLLDLLKRAITGVINPLFARSKQCYFEMDSKLELNIRPYLLRAWFYQATLLKPEEWQQVEVYDDIEIYNDLFRILYQDIYKYNKDGKMFMIRQTPELTHVQNMLFLSFVQSELQFSEILDELQPIIIIPSNVIDYIRTVPITPKIEDIIKMTRTIVNIPPLTIFGDL